jgi:hypothetical protein
MASSSRIDDLKSLMTIEYSDLSGFNDVGAGSFGKVQKADYLGTDVAIKECFRLTNDTQVGFDFEKYLRREIDTLK